MLNRRGSSSVSNTLLLVKDRLATVNLMPVLQVSLKRHYENLELLAQTLRGLGMDDREIDRNVLEVFEEYERELLRTISEMMKGAVQ